MVGAGTAGYYAARNSQDAIEAYRPIFSARLAAFRRLGLEPVLRREIPSRPLGAPAPRSGG